MNLLQWTLLKLNLSDIWIYKILLPEEAFTRQNVEYLFSFYRSYFTKIYLFIHGATFSQLSVFLHI